MDVSKLVIEEKKSKLSKVEIGKLRKKRFAQVSAGALNECKSRKDVAKVLGIIHPRNGYVYVSNLIKKGELIEENRDGELQYWKPGRRPKTISTIDMPKSTTIGLFRIRKNHVECEIHDVPVESVIKILKEL